MQTNNMLLNLWRFQTWDTVLDKQPRLNFELRVKCYWKCLVTMILAFKMSITSFCFKIYNSVCARQWNSDQWTTGRIWVRNSWDVWLYAILIEMFLWFKYPSERPWRKITRADPFLLTESKRGKGVSICVCFSGLQMVLVLCCPWVKSWFDFLTHGFVLNWSTVCSEVTCVVLNSCGRSQDPDTPESPVILISFRFAMLPYKGLKD